MRELHDIETALLDEDGGSCRDLTFEGVSWDGVAKGIERLAGTSKVIAARDDAGREISRPFANAVASFSTSQRPGVMFFAFERGEGLLKRFSVFVLSDDEGSPYFEVTFFPGDVARPSLKEPSSLKDDFLAWADELRETLCARRYYVRYENASWDLGDTGPTSGVFFVSNEDGPHPRRHSGAVE